MEMCMKGENEENRGGDKKRKKITYSKGGLVMCMYVVIDR